MRYQNRILRRPTLLKEALLAQRFIKANVNDFLQMHDLVPWSKPTFVSASYNRLKRYRESRLYALGTSISKDCRA